MSLIWLVTWHNTTEGDPLVMSFHGPGSSRRWYLEFPTPEVWWFFPFLYFLFGLLLLFPLNLLPPFRRAGVQSEDQTRVRRTQAVKMHPFFVSSPFPRYGRCFSKHGGFAVSCSFFSLSESRKEMQGWWWWWDDSSPEKTLIPWTKIWPPHDHQRLIVFPECLFYFQGPSPPRE